MLRFLSYTINLSIFSSIIRLHLHLCVPIVLASIFLSLPFLLFFSNFISCRSSRSKGKAGISICLRDPGGHLSPIPTREMDDSCLATDPLSGEIARGNALGSIRYSSLDPSQYRYRCLSKKEITRLYIYFIIIRENINPFSRIY